MTNKTNTPSSKLSDATPLDQSTLLSSPTAMSWSRFFGLWTIPFVIFNLAMQWQRIRGATPLSSDASGTATIEQQLFIGFWWLVGNSLLMVLLVVSFAIKRHRLSKPLPL